MYYVCMGTRNWKIYSNICGVNTLKIEEISVK
jgi:hypothetical protein